MQSEYQPPWRTKNVSIIRPPVKWHGGKRYLAKRIIEQFPAHYSEMTYVEPCGGAASVLLNKEPSAVEVYNDKDSEIVNLFRVLRDRGDKLKRRLSLTPYAQKEFRESCSALRQIDDIERARRFYVRCRQSIGGTGQAWSRTLHRSRRNMADVVSGFLSSIDENLPLVIDRLRCVQHVDCRTALDVVLDYDSPNTLIYLDPPYHPETRTAPKAYRKEFSAKNHGLLIRRLKKCQSWIAISGYRCKLYDRELADWRRVEIDMPNHSAKAKKKQRRTECLWMNYD